MMSQAPTSATTHYIKLTFIEHFVGIEISRGNTSLGKHDFPSTIFPW